MVDRTHRDLSIEDIARIAGAYRAWRGNDGAAEYADVPGFCKSAPLEEIRRHGHVLTPGRYVGAEPQADDGEPFQEKMARLASQWRGQQVEARRLDAAIAENLEKLGFGPTPSEDNPTLADLMLAMPQDDGEFERPPLSPRSVDL